MQIARPTCYGRSTIGNKFYLRSRVIDLRRCPFIDSEHGHFSVEIFKLQTLFLHLFLSELYRLWLKSGSGQNLGLISEYMIPDITPRLIFPEV